MARRQVPDTSRPMYAAGERSGIYAISFLATPVDREYVVTSPTAAPLKAVMKLQRLISVGVSARTSTLCGENVMNSRRFMLTSPWRLVASPASACHPVSLIFTPAIHDLPALG